MLPASSSPVDLPLRRITFICCICMMLFTACSDIPDQDPCIEIDAVKNDGRLFTVDTTKVFDTTASKLSCVVKYKNGTVANDWPVTLFFDSTQVRRSTGANGLTDFGWISGGSYTFGIGDPAEYPCALIHNLTIPGGRGCEITITLPINE